jgi:hypothetical protein
VMGPNEQHLNRFSLETAELEERAMLVKASTKRNTEDGTIDSEPFPFLVSTLYRR